MHALVVFESMYGNTKEVATAVAAGLSTRMPVEISEVGSAPSVIGDDVSLLVVGAPTHAHGLSQPDSRRSAVDRSDPTQPIVSTGIGLREWLGSLASAPTHVQVAAFDTRLKGPGLLWGSAAKAAESQLRKVGAAVSLISDGDVAGVIHCADPKTGIDMYLGAGGAPEGVLAAAALRCIGGQMQCRLILDSEDKRERAHKMGVTDPRMIYGIEDMARGDCLFAATGVTTGSLLSGVKFRKDVIETETVVMRSVTGTVRYIKAEHRQLEKFHLD